jgi:hypothetical protein
MMDDENIKKDALEENLFPISFLKKMELKKAHRVVFSTKNKFYNTNFYVLNVSEKPISKIL